MLAAIYKTLFGWVDIWLQRKADSALLYDVRSTFFFLFPAAEIVKEPGHAVPPCDYATVRLNYKNICFYFSRGRGEVNILLSPRHVPLATQELAYVVAVFDSVNISKVRTNGGLDGAADLLRPRLEALNEAFSEHGYAEFSKRL
jgi:hypothetical protein